VYRNGVKLGIADFTATSGTTVILASGATAGDLVETVSFFVSSVLNAIPAVANAVTETYINTGAVTQSKLGAGVAGNGPAFSAYTNSTTQTIGDSTLVKVLFQVEEFDTNNNFASSIFTPTVAGYYQINACTVFNPVSASGLSFPAIYKNGSRYKDGCATPFNSGVGQYATISSVVYANGSTDYFEIYVYQNTGSSKDLNVNDQARNWFNGSMIRAA
jgi:hypothetical protein